MLKHHSSRIQLDKHLSASVWFFFACQSAEQDIASLEVEVKTLNDNVTTCKSQLVDYSETSAQIQAELIENINELEQVNVQLESGKKVLEDQLHVMNENQRRSSQTLRCGTASCTQLKNEQARLQ
jgi:chromosome segregation ATPase